MNKYFLCFSLLICILFFSSCMTAGSVFFNDSTKMVDTRFEQILETVEEQNKEALRQMFSQRVLDETEDFDEKLDVLFDIIQGEPESWAREGGPVKSEENEYGHKIKNLCAWYDVKTDKGEYIIMFRECTVDTDNPDNIGLFMLNVVSVDEKDTLFESPIIGRYRTEE